uniref:UDENN domain-containing protein n=1 Tax=Romanomermis culicivorax TaxID=13658 RepID=A0A915IRG3_ROMCU
MRRSSSCEKLYSVPCVNKAAQFTSPQHCRLNTSLYYCVSELPSHFLPNLEYPVPKPRKSKRLLFKSNDNDNDQRSNGNNNDYATISTNTAAVSVSKNDHVVIRKNKSPTTVNAEEDTVSLSSCTADADQRAARAKMTRRKTLMHYDQQEFAFKCRRVPQLFEIVVVVELQPNDRSNPLFTGKFMPALCYQFPSGHRQKGCPSIDPALLASLPCLCYPDLSRATPKLPADHNDEHFVITTTDQRGDRKFAFCCRFVPTRRSSDFDVEKCEHADEQHPLLLPSLPQVICLVTPIQAVQFYSDFIRECVHCLRISIQTLSNFLFSSFNAVMPLNGQKLVIQFMMENGKGDRQVQLINSLLSERRVLIVGDCVSAVTKIIQACAAMLAPFEWPHTLIPVVPDSHVQLCFSPTPYLIGILRSNLHELRQLLISGSSDGDEEEYLLIYDLDYGIVKESDFNGCSITDNILLSSSHDSYRFFPSRTLKTLKNNLKLAYNKKNWRDCSRRNNNNNTNHISLCSIWSPDLCSDLDEEVSDALIDCFAHLLGTYKDFIVKQQDGRYTFLKEQYLRSQHASSTRSLKSFLRWFVETGMFQIWMRNRLEIFNEMSRQCTVNDSLPKTKLLTCEDDLLDAKINDYKMRIPTSTTGDGNSRRFLNMVARRFNFWIK